ncbi:MAG: patatin-like phospholipase family protein, partial [Burkholderiales bacterium]|nr:patatin-like phospholipase family protein [Burkholderiales bacterium]
IFKADMALSDGRSVGIALSGGGFRATLFGLGSLWYLSDARLLGRLDRVCSVSGGSILAGVLAHQWKSLKFEDGKAVNFQTEIVERVLRFCSQTIDWQAGGLGILNPFKSAGDYLAGRYSKDLFGNARLSDLPTRSQGGAPLFVIYATNLQTGRSFRFTQDYVADYYLGTNSALNPTLALAVAASSAFPPIFSPISIRAHPTDWQNPDWRGSEGDLKAIQTDLELGDGGIYDNLGLESLREDVALVSDAGAPFQPKLHIQPNYVSQLARVRDILIDQTRALRKRELLDSFKQRRRNGTYWGITTSINDYPALNKLLIDSDVTRAHSKIDTRLSSLPRKTQCQLVNWGYALADAAVRSYALLDKDVPSALPLTP